MLFREVKPNYVVHIYDSQAVEYKKGKVTNVSIPYYPREYNASSYGQMSSASSGMMVDVTIEIDGRTATYAIPENSSTTWHKNIVLSTELNSVIREIEAANRAADADLAEIDQKKIIKERTSQLLVDLNPVYKKEKETEDRFNKLETNMDDMKKMLENFIKDFKN